MPLDTVAIKDEIEKMKCSIHNESIKVHLSGRMMDFEKPCCEQFMIEVKERYKELLRNQTEDDRSGRDERL
ncbi:MAG: hypothetical protein H0X33_10040 [Taibaiella sp.]|nr:hypothetical protein [Taibaiella sp.]